MQNVKHTLAPENSITTRGAETNANIISNAATFDSLYVAPSDCAAALRIILYK